MASDIVIFPAQAARISQEAAVTGAAIGVSQDGNSLIIETGRKTIRIGAAGQDLPNPEQEKLC
jgi:predicted Rossmann fold nucleotide-binding protein DprA/Smf involved in DNA uptake